MAGKAGHRSFGYLRRLPSRRWQATYVGPDLQRHRAPTTFTARIDAEAWLLAERQLIESDGWTAPAERRTPKHRANRTFGAYAETWIAYRGLKPRTISHYRGLLDRIVLPRFGDMPLTAIHPEDVREWNARLGPTPTQNAHAYALLKAILATAVDDGILSGNPCRIRGAGQAKRASRTEPATPEELCTLVAALPVRYRAMALLASWCALRFGELIELRRSDIDLVNNIVRVQRAAVWVDGQCVVGSPKSDAGIRSVTIPPHIVSAIRDHLRAMPMSGRDALLFPAAGDHTAHLRPATLSKVFYRARAAAGRPDLRWHDLRHTGAVMATLTGASLAEVMARLGHSTPAAAMRYQHVARGRDTEIASRLSALAVGRTAT